MPLPSINITFRTLGITAIQRSQKGVVALIVRGDKLVGGKSFTNINEIPTDWCDASKEYAKRAFTGYINPPRKVIVYMMDGEEHTLQSALDYLRLQEFDYLAGPPDITEQEADSIANWVKSERQNHHLVKAVLPHVPADHEGIINFTTPNIHVGEGTYTAAEYCSRIAGLIAGTPMTISCTYAPLPEVTDVERMSKEEMDEAIDKGEFILFHDGEKVKVGRGVNSFVTTIQGKGADFKKIKIVEAMDMIDHDIRMTAQDNYIGKYANSYDNKCLLIMAIKGYLEELERAVILERDTSVVQIDLDAQEIYLKKKGINTENMTEHQVKTANTDDQVFLHASIIILDAIENIDLTIDI